MAGICKGTGRSTNWINRAVGWCSHCQRRVLKCMDDTAVEHAACTFCDGSGNLATPEGTTRCGHCVASPEYEQLMEAI